MQLIVGRRKIAVASLPEASERYSALRDASGFGASRFPNGKIMDGGRHVANVSYNGRIWPLGNWHPDMTPIYDNR